MFSKIVKKCKSIFNQILGDHWEKFKEKHPKYDTPQYNDPIEKAFDCGKEQGGYTEYRCYECGQGMKRIAFSCKSSFCLSCGKVYTDNVVSQISKNLHAGMSYRHIVLTIPEQLRDFFFKNRFDGKLLSAFMKTGYECLENAVSKTVRAAVKIGCVLVVKNYRQRYIDGCGKDPFICPHCGKEMSLWEIWHPKYGVIYSEKNGYRKRKKRLAG